jgi:hypothetical protein
MIKKTFFLSLLALTAFLLFAQSPQVEARGHHRSRTSLNVSVGTACSDIYTVRRYAQPIVVATPAPIYVPATYYRPCITPTYVYQVPTIVEEVRVAPIPRPFMGFGGLSFSWNFFK